MDKKHREEEHENDERWLLTYADLITLLMVFFVVMYAISKADSHKFSALSKSMNQAFGTPRSSVVPMPAMGKSRSTATRKPQHEKGIAKGLQASGDKETALQKIAKQLQEMIKARNLQDSISLDGSADGRKLTIRLRDSVLFDKGGAEITSEAQKIIDQLGLVLRDIGIRVNVSGHTDNTPIKSGAYSSNWALSTARATAVIIYLVDHVGFEPHLLSSSGYGEYNPLVPNDTPENRAKNRRVEFVITDEGNAAPPEPRPGSNAARQTSTGDAKDTAENSQSSEPASTAEHPNEPSATAAPTPSVPIPAPAPQ